MRVPPGEPGTVAALVKNRKSLMSLSHLNLHVLVPLLQNSLRTCCTAASKSLGIPNCITSFVRDSQWQSSEVTSVFGSIGS